MWGGGKLQEELPPLIISGLKQKGRTLNFTPFLIRPLQLFSYSLAGIVDDGVVFVFFLCVCVVAVSPSHCVFYAGGGRAQLMSSSAAG